MPRPPYLAAHGRCIAPDLIGMGDSEPSGRTGRDAYTFAEHRRYLDGLLDTLGIDRNVILVLHDWGTGLGFGWARRNRERVQGIVYMEAIVQPATWADWPESGRDIFQAMRSEAGEDMVLEKTRSSNASCPRRFSASCRSMK